MIRRSNNNAVCISMHLYDFCKYKEFFIDILYFSFRFLPLNYKNYKCQGNVVLDE